MKSLTFLNCYQRNIVDNGTTWTFTALFHFPQCSTQNLFHTRNSCLFKKASLTLSFVDSKTALKRHRLLMTRFSTPCCSLSASFRAGNYVQSHSGQFVTRAEKKTTTGTRKKHVLRWFSSTTKEICLKCVKLHLAYLTMKNILSRLPFNFIVPLKDNEI